MSTPATRATHHDAPTRGTGLNYTSRSLAGAVAYARAWKDDQDAWRQAKRPPRMKPSPIVRAVFGHTTPASPDNLTGDRWRVYARCSHPHVDFHAFTRLSWYRNGELVATTFVKGNATQYRPDWSIVDRGEIPETATPDTPAARRLQAYRSMRGRLDVSAPATGSHQQAA